MKLQDSSVAWAMVLILVIFLVNGDPDVWDKLHAYIIGLQP